MKTTYPKVAEDFAHEVVKENFKQAYSFFAKAVQKHMSFEQFEEMIKKAEKDVVPARAFDMDTNKCSFDDIKTSDYRGNASPDEKVFDDLDPANYKGWLCIQFKPDPADEKCEFDACYDFWCMVLTEDGQEKIGFFEIHDPD